MDSDQLSEPSPKRQKTAGQWARAKPSNADDASDDELFDNFDTIATQPLQRNYQRQVGRHPSLPSQRPYKSQSQTQPRTQEPSSFLLDTLQSIGGRSTFQTQPTQPLDNAGRSSPEIEVLASSPVRPSPNTAPARPFGGAVLAPPGTSFRRPNTIAQPRPAPHATQTSQFSQNPFSDEPPVHISDDENDNPVDVSLKPTDFEKNGNMDFSRFAYNSRADDLSAAYGGRDRKPRPQTGPSRAMPVQRARTIHDIKDHRHRTLVVRMQLVLPNVPVDVLLEALVKAKGNFDDAVNNVFAAEDGVKPTSIDLTSSDIENNAAKSASKPKMKQNVRSGTTIMNRYQLAAARVAREGKPPIIRPETVKRVEEPIVVTDSPPSKPRKRLQQGRKQRTPSPDPEEEDDELVKSETPSDDSEAEEVRETDSTRRLLTFMNTAAAADVADLANTDLETAEMIISHRPFKNLDAIRIITTEQPTKGKRMARKAIGEKVLDVCEDMWEGYEAVDQLVDQCKSLGGPIFDAMKKWGLDVDVAKAGELEVTKIDEAHDSGIGTPSSLSLEDDTGPQSIKKRSSYLRQPEIMSKDRPMKDYQIFGLNWLNLLWSKRLSCILADDMGLGKTCQVVAFLAHLKETGVEGTHLVIVPGSTLENWLREFKSFCPSIVFQPYYGLQAERAAARTEIEENLSDIDVIVTTYETASNIKDDNRFLRKVIRPRVVVFDEGHMLKNAESKRHRELMAIPAQFRLLLTGTPLQNNLQELASLLGFILPQLFEESRESLRRIFSHKATTRDNSSHAALLSAQRIARARSMMAPFILRRKKAQVLSAMPAKTRRIEYCDMVPSQAQIWEELTEQFLADSTTAGAPPTNASVRSGARAKKHVHMMSLRNCALHPLLLRRYYNDKKLKKIQDLVISHPNSELRDNKPDLVWQFLTGLGGDFAIHKWLSDRTDFVPTSLLLHDETASADNAPWMTASGKIPMFTDLLLKWTSSGSRTLVFSQFTSMLDILESVLETLGLTFVRLDGSTPMADRQNAIDAFTNDTSIAVFLLSTKAGGAGINLAAANKVLIMEAGFNPQDEIQAENRAHRVGQTRDVEVVRLISRGTVEEMILRLGESKIALDERVGEGIGSGTVGEDDAKAEGDVEGMLVKSLIQRREEMEAAGQTGAGAKVRVKREDGDDDSSGESDAGDAFEGKEEDEDEEDEDEEDEEEEEVVKARPTRAARRAVAPPVKTAPRADVAGAFRRDLRRRGVDVG